MLLFVFIQSSDDDLDEFEVELHRGSRKGLGMTIAGLVNTVTGGEHTHTPVTFHTHVPDSNQL